MTPIAVIITIAAYFGVMYLVSWLSSRNSDNSAFFSGGRSSNWLIATIAMIGAALSGVTFVSVPGMVASTGMGYIQMCLGFIVGYIVIAGILTPVFFKMNVVSIYQYLEDRFGMSTYKTGAWFFFISKMLGASVRLFLACLALHLLVCEPLGIPFAVTTLINVGIVLVYTFRGGVKSVIWTDTLKTFCMVMAVVLSIIFIAKNLGFDFGGLIAFIKGSDQSRIFFFDDVNHPEYFWKQFLGGLFTVVACTGLDQDMMQRTLSCKNYKDSQKNLILSSVLQVVVISLFLSLGILLYAFAAKNGITATGDKLFPAVATSGLVPAIVGIFFIVGLVSSAYGAGGSALTALTTSFTVDILGIKGKSEEQVAATRKKVHLVMAALMAVSIYVFNILNNTSTIDAVYKIASYTYGPILGMFTFGLFCKKKVRDQFVPVAAIVAPVLSYILASHSEQWFGGYKFSYELLLINAAFTVIGMMLLIKKEK